jgi:uncharacterized membrane-anchored protein YitT (DUF2179 family)
MDSSVIDSLLTTAVFLTFCAMGLIQYVKEISFLKNSPKRLLTFLIALGVLLLNTSLVPIWVTQFFNMLFFILSLLKLGHDAFLEGVPAYIRSRFALLSANQTIETKNKS